MQPNVRQVPDDDTVFGLSAAQGLQCRNHFGNIILNESDLFSSPLIVKTACGYLL